MKIVVAIKQVPSRDSQLKVNSSGTWIEDADLAWEINEPDAYALEAGLQLREKLSGRSGGPLRGAGRRGADHSRSSGEGRGSRDSHRDRTRPGHRSSGAGAHDGEGARIRKAGSGPHRPAVGRSRLWPDRRHSGGSDGAAARHDHHEHRGVRATASRSSANWRTAGSSTSKCRCPRC